MPGIFTKRSIHYKIFSLTVLLAAGLCLSAKAQDTVKAYNPGTYCTTDDQKVNVLIATSCRRWPYKNENSLMFKTTEDGQKQWIAASSLKWFTVKTSSVTDSFVVSRSSLLSETGAGFVQVILDNQHYKLYRTTTYNKINNSNTTLAYVGGPSAITTGRRLGSDDREIYFFGTEANNLTEVSHSIFADIMVLIMADKPEVVAAINKKEFKYGHMDDLLLYYTTGIISHRPEEN